MRIVFTIYSSECISKKVIALLRKKAFSSLGQVFSDNCTPCRVPEQCRVVISCSWCCESTPSQPSLEVGTNQKWDTSEWRLDRDSGAGKGLLWRCRQWTSPWKQPTLRLIIRGFPGWSLKETCLLVHVCITRRLQRIAIVVIWTLFLVDWQDLRQGTGQPTRHTSAFLDTIVRNYGSTTRRKPHHAEAVRRRAARVIGVTGRSPIQYRS